ncbi:MAG: DUF4249 domain-containing protein [Muribaculaceae bacterium]|nr:DUF4249 domain-containing protein [Muribaculaceae bacterium]
MAILKYIIPLIFISVGMTGCYSDFEPDLESTPVVCINADVKVGEELIIFVTRTWRWSENVSGKSLDLTDANVKLYVNGKEFEELSYSIWEHYDPMEPWTNTQSGFRSTYIPQSGDNIRIVAHSPRYGDAEGEVTVPYPVAIEVVEAVADFSSNEDSRYIRYEGNAALQVFFTDPAEETDYYLVKASVNGMYGNTLYTQGWISFESEPLFTEHMSSLESVVSDISGYTLFTDRMIAGKRYPLHMRLENVVYTIDKEVGFGSNQAYVNICLNTISKSYYNHVLSVWESNDGINGILGGIGLADSVWEYSNVSTGAGVISASASSEVSLPLSSIVVH